MERARQERPKAQAEQSPQGPKKKVKRPDPVLIRTGRVQYVDEFGDLIPDFTAEAMLPPWVAISMAMSRFGLEPFSEGELEKLCVVSAPVAQRWAGTLLPYMAEITLAGTLLWIMFPKVKAKVARENQAKAEQNKKAAQEKPAAPPAAPVQPRPIPPRETAPAPKGSGEIPLLPETRLSDVPLEAPKPDTKKGVSK